MIFPKIKCESVVQVGDRVRIDCTKTFASNEEITSLKVKAEASEEFVDILNAEKDNWFLDWAYQGAGIKVISLVINGSETHMKTIEVLSVEDDKLFSNDDDINPLESDLEYLYKKGRNSHLDIHREAQKQILEELTDRGVLTSEGERLTKANITDSQELRTWSKYLTLYLIFNDVRKGADDAYTEKANLYKALAQKASKDKSFLKLDLDSDGNAETVAVSMSSVSLVRR